MRYTDVLIAGGGLAGSTAAAMLGRTGIDAVLVDPHDVYPADFRCEKLDELQVALLERTGLAGPVLSAATREDDVWIVRFGRLVEKRPNRQYNLLYDTMVNAVRAQIPRSVPFICGKVASIVTSNDGQKITLSSGEEFSARLVVIANGLNIGLRHALGMTREIISEGHSISIGFDLRPAERKSFDFRALTYYADRTSDQIAYLALFTIGSTMRANFFVYRDMHDPWLRQLRQSPQPTMFATMRGLRKLTGDFEVSDRMTIRPVDLYVTKGYEQPGVVLVGDAFGTSCPAAGTGSNKVFTDVERLCKGYIPKWIMSDGMAAEKVMSFYKDSAKRACDEYSAGKAFYLRSFQPMIVSLGEFGAGRGLLANMETGCFDPPQSGYQRRRSPNVIRSRTCAKSRRNEIT